MVELDDQPKRILDEELPEDNPFSNVLRNAVDSDDYDALKDVFYDFDDVYVVLDKATMVSRRKEVPARKLRVERVSGDEDVLTYTLKDDEDEQALVERIESNKNDIVGVLEIIEETTVTVVE
jgi:hypothetical protein